MGWEVPVPCLPPPPNTGDMKAPPNMGWEVPVPCLPPPPPNMGDDGCRVGRLPPAPNMPPGPPEPNMLPPEGLDGEPPDGPGDTDHDPGVECDECVTEPGVWCTVGGLLVMLCAAPLATVCAAFCCVGVCPLMTYRSKKVT